MPPLDWIRGFFYDHPDTYETNRQAALANAAKKDGKHRVWCKRCWSARMLEERAKDEAEVQLGQRVVLRDRATISSFRAS